jgi:hypothetical protein
MRSSNHPQVGVHAFDSLVIALGVFSLCRRLLPLALLGRLRYFLHACGTAFGLHYAVRLACRLGVGWASDRWVQLHAGAGASGLLVRPAPPLMPTALPLRR